MWLFTYYIILFYSYYTHTNLLYFTIIHTPTQTYYLTLLNTTLLLFLPNTWNEQLKTHPPLSTLRYCVVPSCTMDHTEVYASKQQGSWSERSTLLLSLRACMLAVRQQPRSYIFGIPQSVCLISNRISALRTRAIRGGIRTWAELCAVYRRLAYDHACACTRK